MACVVDAKCVTVCIQLLDLMPAKNGVPNVSADSIVTDHARVLSPEQHQNR